MSDVPDRLTAALADRYGIERRLGQGGMATVYLAEDLKHKRKVAVKVLRPELAAVIGADRFLKEIEVTANLQHPHILPLFDSGEADSFLYYVMPYVEGETLRDKLAREKQFSVDEAVRITHAVASALDYAHRHDVIHRDIKPENILLHEGQPQVADFGIALAVSQAGGTRITETGLSLGTPHYMSPEQATADRELDARSDIYSLGAIAYEMLLGDPPHTGGTAQAVIASVLTEEPRALTARRSTVPAHVEAAVLKALAKLPADRFGSAQAFAAALENPAFSISAPAAPGLARPAAARWNRLTLTLAGLSGVLTVLLVLALSRAQPELVREVSRFTVELPEDRGLGQGGDYNGPGVAITADGSRFAYLGLGDGATAEIVVRPRDQLAATSVRSTVDVRCCLSFSPDGESITYITVPIELKVVSLRGGLPTIAADSGLQDPSLYGGGVDWGPDGLLYLSMVSGLWRMTPQGEDREQLTTVGPDERTHAWPDVLPGGRGALVTIIPRNSLSPADYTIGVADFATGEIDVLFQGVYSRYASSGHIVFVQDDGTLLGARFNPERLEVEGPAVALIEGVEIVGYGAARLALSDNGTLIYRRGGAEIERLMWVDRRGVAESLATELVGGLQTPRLAPDGSRFAVGFTTDEGEQLWTQSLTEQVPLRHTFEGQLNWRHAWSPEGKGLYFISDRMNEGAIYYKPVDGAGVPVLVALPDPRPIFEVLPVDAQTLVVRTDNQAPGNGDILLARLGADTVVEPLVATAAGEFAPAVSPDRRWLAYSSDESGRNEVYVRPFPDVSAGRWQISSRGGTEPVWARSGRELFYRDAEGAMIAVDIAPGTDFGVARQRALFSSIGYAFNVFNSQYDVSLDGERFLMVALGGDARQVSEIVVVMNWLEELKTRVP